MPTLAVNKYLRTRACIAPWRLDGCPRNLLHAAIVIPALGEADSLPLTLASLAGNPAPYLARTLIVVVVNQRADTDPELQNNNRRTLQWLQTHSPQPLNLAWIDAASGDLSLPAKDGVGMARRIGFDLSLLRLDWRNDPLLISLDADSLVDSNYLPAIFEHFRTFSSSGAYLPFRHQQAATPDQETAIRDYELFLRSTEFGLNWAGSPYAFTSIGSALACRGAAYVAAGGMPRRLAGEDFYFLQQLVKIGKVNRLYGTRVSPSPRLSERVPFGTGRAVATRITTGEKLYSFTSTESFQILRSWLRLIEEQWQAAGEVLVQQAEAISPLLAEFLRNRDFIRHWRSLQTRSPGKNQVLLGFHGWFDGLRTRQLLHLLNKEDDDNSESLVAKLLAAGGYPHVMQRPAQLKLLESLQGI
jgi:hypothetical protein